MPAATLDYWYDLASTYSYLAAARIRPLAQAAGATVRFRPFLLGPLFKAQGWDSSPFTLFPAKGRHMWRDMERETARYGLPFKRPAEFPQNSVLAARVAMIGMAEGWGEDFSLAVFHAEFGEGRALDEATLRGVLAKMKRDPAAALATAQSDANKAALRAQTDEAQRLGIFGAPTFTTADGELFWGNDRLEQALAWSTTLKGRAASAGRTSP
jgi:2-hydroxychromene-2-carboxylate isomerase